jgi:hypothetical protein
MTTNTPPARSSLFNWIVNIFIFGFAIFMLWLLLPFAIERFSAGPLALPKALPTSEIMQPTARPTPPATTSQDGSGATEDRSVVVVDGIAQNAATAQAMFDAAVAAGEDVPNINATGESAPALLVSKPSVREGAGANVPTAEPLVQTNERFGSKAAPVDIQATKECKHGQVWVDGKGCRNP